MFFAGASALKAVMAAGRAQLSSHFSLWGKM
jgi:hypothetical protein